MTGAGRRPTSARPVAAEVAERNRNIAPWRTRPSSSGYKLSEMVDAGEARFDRHLGHANTDPMRGTQVVPHPQAPLGSMRARRRPRPPPQGSVEGARPRQCRGRRRHTVERLLHDHPPSLPPPVGRIRQHTLARPSRQRGLPLSSRDGPAADAQLKSRLTALAGRLCTGARTTVSLTGDAALVKLHRRTECAHRDR